MQWLIVAVWLNCSAPGVMDTAPYGAAGGGWRGQDSWIIWINVPELFTLISRGWIRCACISEVATAQLCLCGTGTFSLFICPEVTHSTAWQRSLCDPGEVQVSPASMINRTAEIQAVINATETSKPALERTPGCGISGRVPPARAGQSQLTGQSIQVHDVSSESLCDMSWAFPFSWCV